MGGYEDILFSNLGQFGLSQIFVFLACNIAEAPASWAMNIMSFAGAVPDWWSVRTLQNATGNHSTVIKSMKTCSSNPNHTIVFAQDVVSIVSEWHLVCDDKWIPALITTIQMVGVLTGGFIVGQLGDFIGRKLCLFGSYFFMLLFTFVSAFSVNWQMFSASRFFIGMSIGGFLVISFNLPMEYAGIKWRTFVACCPSWGIGVAIMGLLAWLVPDWRKLSMILAALGTPLLLTWWVVPESCRWLLAHGRIEEAGKVLTKMAKINKKPPPDLAGLKRIVNEDEAERSRQKVYTIRDVVCRWALLRNVIIFGYMHMSINLAYYGLTLGVVKLAGDRYLNLALTGIMDAGGVIVVFFISTRLHRRNTTMALFFLSGGLSVAIGISYFIASESDFKQLQNGLSLGAKFFTSAAFISLLITTSEGFPTVIRNIGYSTCSTCGRVGSLLAPQVLYIYNINIASPYIVFGSLLLISGFLCLLNRDTYRAPLEDNIESDMERRKELSKSADANNVSQNDISPHKLPKANDSAGYCNGADDTRL